MVFYKVRSSKVVWVTFLVEFLLRNETGPVMHLSTGPLLVKAIEHLPCALAFFQLVKTFVNSPEHSLEYTIHLKSFPMHNMKKTWPNLSFFTLHSFPKLTSQALNPQPSQALLIHKTCFMMEKSQCRAATQSLYFFRHL